MRYITKAQSSAHALKRKLRKYVSDESGATAIEYGLIVAGVAVAIIVVVRSPSVTSWTKCSWRYRRRWPADTANSLSLVGGNRHHVAGSLQVVGDGGFTRARRVRCVLVPFVRRRLAPGPAGAVAQAVHDRRGSGAAWRRLPLAHRGRQYHDERRAAGVPHIRRLGGVRARDHPRADHGRAGVSGGSRVRLYGALFERSVAVG